MAKLESMFSHRLSHDAAWKEAKAIDSTAEKADPSCQSLQKEVISQSEDL